jgi:hypothetical protein
MGLIFQRVEAQHYSAGLEGGHGFFGTTQVLVFFTHPAEEMKGVAFRVYLDKVFYGDPGY